MISDRAALLAIVHWRSEADKAFREGNTEAFAAWSFCAENLAREMGFCGVCLGRGAEFSAGFEDDDVAGWYGCFMCKATGTSPYFHQCRGCGLAERLFSEEDPGLCTSCYRASVTLPDFVQAVTRPLGAQFGPRESFARGVSKEILPGYWVEESGDVVDDGAAQS